MIVAAAVAAPEFGLSAPVAALLAAAYWYALEALLAARRRLAARLAEPARLARPRPAVARLWGEGWKRDNFVWRGNAMSVDEANLQEASGPPPGR